MNAIDPAKRRSEDGYGPVRSPDLRGRSVRDAFPPSNAELRKIAYTAWLGAGGVGGVRYMAAELLDWREGLLPSADVQSAEGYREAVEAFLGR